MTKTQQKIQLLEYKILILQERIKIHRIAIKKLHGWRPRPAMARLQAAWRKAWAKPDRKTEKSAREI